MSTNNNQVQSKPASQQQNLPPIRNIKPSVHFRNHALPSSLIEKDNKPKTIRYINSDHGLEVQRYSSGNCLSIDLLSKDACPSHEKVFREMLDKREENELSSDDIYTLEYYRQRYDDLLQSYKQGNLTHDQWAKQNYQLHSLKILYTQAIKREQARLNLQEQNLRQRRAQNVFNQWKEAKDEGSLGRHRNHSNTVHSQQTIERTSARSNPSTSLPDNTTKRISVSSTIDNQQEDLPIVQPIHSLKNNTITSNTLYMLSGQRSSFQAMLKRVVGLAEPLPPLPKIINGQYSSMINLSNDNDGACESSL